MYYWWPTGIRGATESNAPNPTGEAFTFSLFRILSYRQCGRNYFYCITKSAKLDITASEASSFSFKMPTERFIVVIHWFVCCSNKLGYEKSWISAGKAKHANTLNCFGFNLVHPSQFIFISSPLLKSRHLVRFFKIYILLRCVIYIIFSLSDRRFLV